MTTITKFILRIGIDTEAFCLPIDVNRKEAAQFWKSNDIEFQLGLFSHGDLIDVSNIDKICLAVKALSSNGTVMDGDNQALMYGETSSLDNSVTPESWTNGTAQHAIIGFSEKETSLAADDYWLSLWIVTKNDAKIVTVCAGKIRIIDGGNSDAIIPPPPPETYYTAAECDMLFANKSKNLLDLDDETVARTNLGLGSMAVQGSDDVDITGGNISGISPLGIDAGGTGSNNKTSAFNNLSPIAKLGDMIVGYEENSSTTLALGNENQVLTVDPTSETGLSWKNYPWKLLKKINLSSSTPAVIFTEVLDSSQFMHYKIVLNCCTKSPVYSLLSIVFGSTVNDETSWITTDSEYFSSLFDLRGNETRYEKYNGTVGYVPLGNSSTNFRSYDGFFNGNISLWKAGDTSAYLQLLAEMNYLWHVQSSGTYSNEAGAGRYSSTFLNSDLANVNSLKIEAISGNITGGNFSIYGIN
ncbi:MAG: hypothetical protein LBH49_04020 [Puniceicoccales bacterium]|jgi:hypothetical protein|nr:hypothetical protein [Puniceicoccales bacterium]